MRKGRTVEERFAVEKLLEVVKHGMDPTMDRNAPSADAKAAAKRFNAIQRRHKKTAGKVFGDLMLTDVDAGLNVLTVLVTARRRKKTKPSRRKK